MILDPGASREHGDFEPRFHSRARGLAPGMAKGGGHARHGRKDWLAGIAVLGLIATLCLWLVGDVERNGGPLFGASHLVDSAEAGALTAAGTGNQIAPMPNFEAVATRLAVNPLRAVDIRILQTRLTEMGFEPGYVDGVAGGRTLDALNRYRDSKNLPPASKIDYGTVTGLLD